MKPTSKPKRTAEQRAEAEAIRRQHEENPIRHFSTSAVKQPKSARY